VISKNSKIRDETHTRDGIWCEINNNFIDNFNGSKVKTMFASMKRGLFDIQKCYGYSKIRKVCVKSSKFLLSIPFNLHVFYVGHMQNACNI
jgi:hypothetical protein